MQGKLAVPTQCPVCGSKTLQSHTVAVLKDPGTISDDLSYTCDHEHVFLADSAIAS